MRYSILLIGLIGCTEPDQTVTFSAPPNLSRASPLRGAHEISEIVKGKKFRLQMKFEEGIMIRSMLYQDTIPLVMTEYSDNNIMRDVWYDSAGSPTLVSVTKMTKQSLIGRCLQFLSTNKLYAQTLTKCSLEYQDMVWAAAQVTSLTTLAYYSCLGVPVTAPACVAALAAVTIATGSYNVARTKYNMCMGTITGIGGSGGGGGGFVNPSQPVTKETTESGSSGGCYVTTVSIYTLGGVLISSSTSVTCK